MLTAAVYVPPDLPRDGLYAQSCMAYAQRRGYPEPVIFRSWDTVHSMLLADTIQVVIVALREHCTDTTAVRPEIVEEASLPTVAILAHRRNARTGHHHHTARQPNTKAMPSADQLIDDAVRCWRQGVRRYG